MRYVQARNDDYVIRRPFPFESSFIMFTIPVVSSPCTDVSDELLISSRSLQMLFTAEKPILIPNRVRGS